jgi:glycerol-3-phosphate dehydrogenase (NAD(P)+)
MLRCGVGRNGVREDAKDTHARDIVLLVVPTPAIEEVISDLDLDPSRHILVSCTKGILNDTLETPDKIIRRLHPDFRNVAFLSGPSFAKEVAESQPTAVTIASEHDDIAAIVQNALSGERFRCYRSSDVIGVELGGALKNCAGHRDRYQ